MRWRGRRQSSNVEDRRGRPGGTTFPGQVRLPIGRAGTGGGLSTIIVLVVLFFGLRAMGIDPMQLLDDTQSGFPAGQGTANDEMSRFVRVVLADTEDVWHDVFAAQGETYQELVLVLFGGRIDSACGYASTASGPFYCPGDRKVYLDLDFFDELARRFDAAGDFARAYVVAHEVGHHVQNLLGVLPRFNQMRGNTSQAEANAMSVRVELQADCLAGVWAYYTAQEGFLEKGDVEEALNAANQIGDDTLQRRTQGYVVPESFNHGTSEQRRRWLARGLESGRVTDCDTFNGPL